MNNIKEARKKKAHFKARIIAGDSASSKVHSVSKWMEIELKLTDSQLNK